jgi:hypothetical protein
VATAVYKLLMMGKRMLKTFSAVFEWRAINLRDWYIWLVDLFEYIFLLCWIPFLTKAVSMQINWSEAVQNLMMIQISVL